MVDALSEARRVLVPRGTVVDVRPITALVTIEVLMADRPDWSVKVDSRGAEEDDVAADAAVRLALSSGWFALMQKRHFEFDVYCDTTADLKAYAETGRRLRDSQVPYEELEAQRRRLGAASSQTARVRCRRPKMLSVYRKGDS